MDAIRVCPQCASSMIRDLHPNCASAIELPADVGVNRVGALLSRSLKETNGHQITRKGCARQKRLSFLLYLVGFCGIYVTFISVLPDAVCELAQHPLRVKLSANTFSPDSFTEMQSLADQIASIIDEMIPGVPEDLPDSVVCFEAPARWSSAEIIAQGYAAPPVTFAGPKVFDEPADVIAGEVRIAKTKWQFAFQLSHELAHVKMGPRTDNYLDETLAVAVSYEVLRRLGFQGYLLINEGAAIQDLPLAIQKQIAYEDWGRVRTYWREKSKTQSNNTGDRSFQSLGALLLLRTAKPHWDRLLNIERFNTCADAVGQGSYKICSPDLAKFKSLRRELQALGFSREDFRR